MSCKSARIRDAIRHLEGGRHDPHLLGFLESFNRQEFYEAHDILEDLWLEDRHSPVGDFYKGLIQLAGAFVHVQKQRFKPALSLLRLARTNLGKYGSCRDGLVIEEVLALIGTWEGILSGAGRGSTRPGWPILSLT